VNSAKIIEEVKRRRIRNTIKRKTNKKHNKNNQHSLRH